MRRRFAALGIIESPGFTDDTRYFARDLMGIGSPAYPVVYYGDQAIVYWPTIEQMLHCFRLTPAQWEATDGE